MSWLDISDEFDPDSAAARDLVMQSLDDAEAEHTVATFTAEPTTARPISYAGHSYHEGPPRLVCSVPWGLMLLREANPTHEAVRAANWELFDSRSELTVRVDWGSMPSLPLQPAIPNGSSPIAPSENRVGAARLVVRHAEREIASNRVDNAPSEELSVTFCVNGAQPGEPFIVELRWYDGSRHLHCLAPLCAPLKLDGLLALPSSSTPSALELLAEPIANHSDGVLPPLTILPQRAFGLEMEVLTLAPDPSTSGCFTKGEELKALIERVVAEEDDGEEPSKKRRSGGSSGSSSSSSSLLRPLLERCLLWTHEVDDHVMTSAAPIAERVASEFSGADDDGTTCNEGEKQRRRDLARLLHGGGKGTMKSEFKSPSPDAGGALRFDRNGAAEVACFVRLVRYLGAGAPAVSDYAHSGGSIHCHVNVTHPTAGGSVLSCTEILNVVFSWIVFDLVTARFARPWMWREPSMAPLYATGSEFAWREKAWEQGCTRSNDKATYDVPRFITAVRELMITPAWKAMSEAEHIEALFGRSASTPSSRIGRYLSLNMRRLTTYGTLEFRRFHGTTDAALIQRWAHFCVAFVEAFKERGAGYTARMLGAPTHEVAIMVLAHAQEGATPASLMLEMAGHVDSSTAAYFMEGSGAIAPSPPFTTTTNGHPMEVTLHVLKLHEPAVIDGNNFERFDAKWLLEDPNGTVAPGDVVFFPELLTGAGEFEALRFACANSASDMAVRTLELQGGGVEMAEFPAGIMSLLEQQPGGPSLRARYHKAFNKMLTLQGLSMDILCEGCDGGVDGYWADVAAGRCRMVERKATDEKWVIPLAACVRDDAASERFRVDA